MKHVTAVRTFLSLILLVSSAHTFGMSKSSVKRSIEKFQSQQAQLNEQAKAEIAKRQETARIKQAVLAAKIKEQQEAQKQAQDEQFVNAVTKMVTEDYVKQEGSLLPLTEAKVIALEAVAKDLATLMPGIIEEFNRSYSAALAKSSYYQQYVSKLPAKTIDQLKTAAMTLKLTREMKEAASPDLNAAIERTLTEDAVKVFDAAQAIYAPKTPKASLK